MAQVDLKRKLIHSQAYDYKVRGSVTLSRELELGDEEKLMEDSTAGDRLKDYYLTPVFSRTRDPISDPISSFLTKSYSQSSLLNTYVVLFILLSLLKFTYLSLKSS